MTGSGVGWGWPFGLLMVGCWALVVIASVWCLAILTRSKSVPIQELRFRRRPHRGLPTSFEGSEAGPGPDRLPAPTSERP